MTVIHDRAHSLSRATKLLLIVAAASTLLLGCTPTSGIEQPVDDMEILSAEEIYPIAHERAQEMLGEVAMLWAIVDITPLRRASFDFISIGDPRLSVLVIVDPDPTGTNVTSEVFETKEPRGLTRTIASSDWEGVDSDRAFQIAYEAEGKDFVEEQGETDLWFVKLGYVNAGDQDRLVWRTTISLPSRAYLDVAVDPQSGEIIYSRVVGQSTPGS